ncbi:MAG: folate-binding protein [Lysobacteraceae bacterium]|nr:MAG: folate-binding protein [Xanthomonadaceae bacterium]
MPDNLSPAAATWFALPDHALLALEGPDSTAFAHAQFANDVAALAAGQWQWNAWLTPKGRVIALFALLKLAGDRLLLLLPDADPPAMQEQLQRFVFRRKVQVVRPSGLEVTASFAAPVSAAGARIGLAGDAIELDYGDGNEARSLRIAATTEAPAGTPEIDRWRASDLRHGLPRLGPAQREQWTPQQLSLERLNAFSVKKGCYPGQEIVARTHFLGKAKRGLALFQADATVASDADISDGQQTLGKVLSVAEGKGSALLLAVLPSDRGTATLYAEDVALRELPLVDGLHR